MMSVRVYFKIMLPSFQSIELCDLACHIMTIKKAKPTYIGFAFHI
ncbi:Putative uncharacterized protein [Moritella viscosa]|uniref:Uncharacterized protein n=1 Tax=Moritella viscosa TaxID=80854 RepID=A0ABY1HM43_9GAMM|nr:Putative uncharacterized protein [Moritella viscosa]SGZ02520.1 Putative uncharacterized protein [Moritella viscosa]